MGLSRPQKKRRSALKLLQVKVWSVLSNPNFYNKVGIKFCPHLHIAGLFLRTHNENGNRFYGRFNFCEGQQMQAEPKIFYCDFFTSEDRRQIFYFRMNFVDMRLDRVRQAASDLRIIKSA